MNTVKSFWLGWGTLCAAGGGAYYFAKKQINADRQAKLEAYREKVRRIEQLEISQGQSSAAGNGGPARIDSTGSPSQEASSDPAPTRHAPETESQRIGEKGKYERASLTSKLHPRLLAMATPELAIAKATLSATLFRADPSSLTRPAVDAFFQLVTSALTQCSRPNVQKCKAWIVDNVASSPARTAALVKYLAALSKNLLDDGERPSAKRRRLHLLYLVNDALHHVVIKNGDAKFATVWDAGLPSLVASAAAFDNCPKHKKKLENLIDMWEEKQYFTSDLVSKLRDALTNGVVSQPTTAPQPSTTSLKLARETPYIVPSLHGDPTTPWYDLPAASWLPHLTPNSTKPMLPDLIRPLQLAPGPADKALATAVKTLLSDVERLFSKEQKPDEDPHVDLNELGERVVLDEITGQVVDGETYYGWSWQFCKKMTERRRRKAKGSSRERSHSRSSSYSRGRSRTSSPPVFKRRRLSKDSRGRSPSRSRTPSRTRDGSRSRSIGRRRDRSDHRRPYSRSPSRSRSPPYHRDAANRPPPQPQYAPPPSFAPPSFPPMPPPVGDYPVPPPPPAGYQGPWPPPPPGAPFMGGAPGAMFPNPGMAPQMQMVGGWPPFPPPPHMLPQNNYYDNGRGRGGFRGRGRGGYDRGRGGW
ncbi:hypothetical protein AK830_g9685 [Neonectria ditissima]|uniref:CID domain-containing protein n=1 Tax=Neonectria ditissima TaxID=78410 RepID=A0A0P7B590_9HYPO|nr:hypothetical protein AK830_g9685 [Neonectria ditissima]